MDTPRACRYDGEPIREKGPADARLACGRVGEARVCLLFALAVVADSAASRDDHPQAAVLLLATRHEPTTHTRREAIQARSELLRRDVRS